MAWSSDVAAGRGRGDGVLSLAQLAQINAAQELVGVDVVGRSLEQAAAVASASCRWPDAEIEIGQRVVQLGGAGVGIERVLVLLDGVGHILGLAGVDGSSS